MTVSGYLKDLALVHSAGFTELARCAAAELIGRLPARSQILDVGCGDGTTAALLVEAGHVVRGIDQSDELISIARDRAPGASFSVASFVDAEFPSSLDAIVAVGEVLGYVLDPANTEGMFGEILSRAAAALKPGGLLVFDVAGPGRGSRDAVRSWTEGQGWAVLVETSEHHAELTRRIVTYRDPGAQGWFRRAEEVHRLRLRRPTEVLGALRAAGFAARTLPRGYAGKPLPPGLTAYLGRRRERR